MDAPSIRVRPVRGFPPRFTMSAAAALLVLAALALSVSSRTAPPSPPIKETAPVTRAKLVATLTSHFTCVYHVVYSPDGKRLATSSKDKTVKLWDAAGKEARTLRGHTGEVYSSAFSPDGKRLATASEDRTVKLWDVASGKETRTLCGHRGEVYNVAFSPNGRTLASASQDHTVRLWDADSGKLQRALSGHTARVCNVVFSPDGRHVASASPSAQAPGQEDVRGEVKLWDAVSGEEVLALSANNPGIVTLAFSPDGRRLAGAAVDKTVKLWEVATGRATLTLKGHTLAVYHLAFSADGRRLASSSCDWSSGKSGEVKLWDLPSGRELLSFRPHPTPIWSVAFDRDGQRLATTTGFWLPNKDEKDAPGEIKIWRLVDLPPRRPLAPPSSAQLDSLWADLAGVDAARAYRAVWTLSAAPQQAVPFLQERARPLKARITAAKIAQLIRDLDDSEFAVREKASAALEQLGRLARPALLEARDSSSLEVRRRVGRLLEKKDDELPPLSAEEVRGLRIVEVLLRIGTPEMRPVLQKLADGGAESPVTKEASAALRWLDHGTSGKSASP
jgi:WD40 repeat protein